MPEPDSRKIFVRSATGLVREISTLDSFFANLAFINIALGVLTYTTAPYIFPGSNVVEATLLATFFSVIVSLMYTLFTWAMPRSGGDYIFVSRILHPAIGFMANFNLSFWYIFFVGLAANWVTTFAIAPSLQIIGTVTSNQPMISLASALTHPVYVMIIGIIVVALVTLLMIRGVRLTFRVNNIIFIISIIGVLLMLGLLFTSNNSGFQTSFDRFASYSNITATAHNAGYSPTGPNPALATFGVMPFVFASTGYGILTSYFAGEAKGIKKNAFYSQVFSTAVGGIVLAALGGLAVSVFGYDFLGSISQLSSTGSSAYPFSVPPYFNLFMSMLSNNPLVLFLLAITFVAAIVVSLPPTYMLASRNIFAWSFDRILPGMFSSVNERFHTPVYAILLVAGINIVGLAVATYLASSFFALSAGVGLAEILSFIIVAIAAIIFPFVKKEFFEKSPANIKLGPIPLISLVGAVSLGFYLLLEYFYFTNSLYGANVPLVYEFLVITFGVPLVVFVASYFYRKSHGVNLSLAFKELPPE